MKDMQYSKVIKTIYHNWDTKTVTTQQFGRVDLICMNLQCQNNQTQRNNCLKFNQNDSHTKWS